MSRRELLQLAHTYKPEKHKIAGWFISEKCDGTRCFWDGGLSRGVPTDLVPWASVTDPKTGRPKAKIDPLLCTGCEICAQVCARKAILMRADVEELKAEAA